MNLKLVTLLLSALAVNGFASDVYSPLPASYLSSLNLSTQKLSLLRPLKSANYLIAAGSSGPIFLAAYPNELYSYNPATGAVKSLKTTYPVDANGLVVSSDGSLVFVETCAAYNSPTCTDSYVEEIAASSGVELGLVRFREEISAISLSPSGGTLYVSHSPETTCCGEGPPGGNAIPHELSRGEEPWTQNGSIPSTAITAVSVPGLTVGASTGALTSPYSVPGPLVVSASETMGYFADGAGFVWSVELPSMVLQNQIGLINTPLLQVVLSPDGSKLAVLEEFGLDLAPAQILFLDAPSLTIIGTVPLPEDTYLSLVSSVDGSALFAGGQFTGMVYEVSPQSMAITASLPAGSPDKLLTYNSGASLYIVQTIDSVVGVFPEGKLAPNQLLALSQPRFLSLSPSGSTLYVSDNGLNSYSTLNGAFLKTYLPGEGIESAATSPTGRELYAAGFAAPTEITPTLFIVDPVSGDIQRKATIPTNGYVGPFVLSVPKEGTKICVSMPPGYGFAAIYDATRNTFVQAGPEGNAGCAIDPTGTFAYVQSGSNLLVINARTGGQIGQISDAIFPVVFSPVAHVAYARSANGINGTSVIDTDTQSVTGAIPDANASTTVSSMAITSDGTDLYEAATTAGLSFVIDTATSQIIGNFAGVGPLAAH